MSSRFFKPFIGDNYTKGIKNGIKLLVLGESHFCIYNKDSLDFNCPYWVECTSTNKKDSSHYNNICPYYDTKDSRVLLEDTSLDEIQNYLDGDGRDSYTNFFNFLMNYFKYKDRESLCSHLAFTNYIQYFLPTRQTPRMTKNDVRNFYAFLETVDEIQPDLVIIWGTPISNHFSRYYIKQLVPSLLRTSNPYVWTMKYNHKVCTLINPYHPCNYRGWWIRELGRFTIELDAYFNQNTIPT